MVRRIRGGISPRARRVTPRDIFKRPRTRIEFQKQQQELARRKAIVEERKRQEEERKRQEEQQRQLAELKQIINLASKLDRGKPFALFDVNKQLADKVRALIKEGRSVKAREEFLRKRYPAVTRSINPLLRGAAERVPTSQKIFGLDPGQKVTVTQRDTKTGAIKSVVVTSKDRQGQVTKTITTFKKEVPQEEVKRIISERTYRDLFIAAARGDKRAQNSLGKIDAFLPRNEIRRRQEAITIKPEELEPKIISSLIKEPKKKKITLVQALKFAFLGVPPEEDRINRKQNSLNKRIESFNKVYGEKSLNEKAHSEAIKISSQLEKEQSALDKRMNRYGSSFLGKLRKIRGERELSSKEVIEQRKKIPKIKSEINRLQKSLNKTKNKNSLQAITLRRGIQINRNQLDKIERGEGLTQVVGSPVPFAPVTTIPRGVTNIKFIGSQKKLKSGKIVTDIAFQTSKGEVGIAKGVTVTKGAKGQSIVMGKFGQKGIQFPTNIQKVGKIKTFVGVETTISKPRRADIPIGFELIKNGKKIGNINVIKKNIDIMAQKGVGRVIVVKGKKLFRIVASPFGKFVRRPSKVLSVDDFTSLSSVMTKKDLSLIGGKTITGKGARAVFEGIIKGSKSIKKFDLSPGGRQQYTIALNKVIATVAAALSRAEKTKGVPASAKFIAANEILTKGIRGKGVSTKHIQRVVQRARAIPVTKGRVKAKVVARVITKRKAKIKPIQKIRVTTKQAKKLKQVLKPALKTKLVQKQKITAKEAQVLKSALRIKLTQKQIQRIVNVGAFIIPVGVISPILKPILVPIKLSKGFSKKKLKKSTQGYYVVIKRKGKRVNLTPRPLTLTDARDFLAYRIDHGLSRSAWFEQLGKKKKVVRPPKVMRGYFSKVRRKLRPFKIRAGRKKAIRQGYIEKKKYIGDTKSEIRALQRARKRKPVKKKIRKRKVVGKRMRPRPRIKRMIKKRVVRRKQVKRRPVKRKAIRRRPIKRKRIKRRKPIKRRPVKRKKLRKKLIRRRPVKRKPVKRRSIKRIKRRVKKRNGKKIRKMRSKGRKKSKKKR